MQDCTRDISIHCRGRLHTYSSTGGVFAPHGQERLAFLDVAIEEFPFPIQWIQTDRGREFFAHEFQKKMMDYGIKFRPIKPASPHLNGKVERSQRTDLEEFYATVDLKSPDLPDRLREWQDYYNQFRPHGSLVS